MEYGGFLPELSTLIGKVACVPDVSKKCELTELEINRQICVNAVPENEGHPALLCGNLINHIVQDIRALLGVHCMFGIFPIVLQELDSRGNKEADYSIYKVFNTVTYYCG